MSKSHKLSLKAAIFMNINIIAGAGLFINTVLLTKMTGIVGCFAYLAVGIFMLPLIKSIAQLVRIHPSGGFYAFIKPLSPFLAFITCWIYFFSKLASTALVLYVSAGFLQQVCPTLLNSLSTTNLSLLILGIFTYLNLFNLEVGSFIQKLFFSAKAIPIIFAIFIGIFTLDTTTIASCNGNFGTFSNSLPFVLYCLAGFEAACSISRNIQKPSINAPKAIYISFFTVVITYTIFQLFMAIMLLPHIESISSYKQAFSLVCTKINLSQELQVRISYIINFLISFSALGGAYGMLFSNTWNLYTLAENNHTFAPKRIMALNKHEIPTVAVLIESIICLIFILVTNGSQVPLQQTAAFGVVLSYSVSIIAIFRQSKRIQKTHILALITCLVLLTSCVTSALSHDFTSLAIFASMTALGAAMNWWQKKDRHPFYN